jgi:translation initiation factor 2 alpha subunit (eIF-2alpha)
MNKINSSKTEVYLDTLEKEGIVKTSIHPEHLGVIARMNEICEERSKDSKAKKKIFELAQKKLEVAHEELWITIHDSYDETMQALSEKASGEALELEKGNVVFKNARTSIHSKGRSVMEDLGMPQSMIEGILGKIDKTIDKIEGEGGGVDDIEIDGL